jgi:hypothetical protein
VSILQLVLSVSLLAKRLVSLLTASIVEAR